MGIIIRTISTWFLSVIYKKWNYRDKDNYLMKQKNNGQVGSIRENKTFELPTKILNEDKYRRIQNIKV